MMSARPQCVRSSLKRVHPLSDHRSDRRDGFPVMRRDRLLDTLEAGKPAVVPTGWLGGWGVPKMPLTDEQKQCGHWFKVFPDDTVCAAEPED